MTKMSDKVLVRINDNWADEMDITGYQVMLHSDYDSYLKKLEQYFKDNQDEPLGYYVGTNEEVEHNSLASVLSCLSSERITEEQYQALSKLNLLSFGFTNLLEIELDLV